MRLFGWFKMADHDKDVQDEQTLLRDLEQVATRSRENQVRIDRIINIEQVRLRNLELRAAILSKSRVH